MELHIISSIGKKFSYLFPIDLKYTKLQKKKKIPLKALLVETLRSIAEILIWGDQNDSSVFDFFLGTDMTKHLIF